MESKRIFKGKHDELQSRLVSDFIGNTPFVRLSDKIYAKLESVNPGGSIKDRPVKWILDDAEDNKLINKKIKTALKAGLKVIFCVGETLNQKKKKNYKTNFK